MSKLRAGTSAVAINGSGGAYTAIKCTQFTERVVISEDPSMDTSAGGAGFQGFQFQLKAENYATTYTVLAGGSFIIQRTAGVEGSGISPLVGIPEQNLANGTTAFNYVAPTEYMKAKSLTATATKLSVLEED